MLKNSNLNRAANVSETLGTRRFLKIAKSTLTSFGPTSRLRPLFPKRFRHKRCPFVSGCKLPALSTLLQSGAIWEFTGTVGNEKQVGSMYAIPLCLKSEGYGLHPGTRFGKSKGSELPWPSGSPAWPNVNGTPVLAVTRPATCQPPAITFKTGWAFGL